MKLLSIELFGQYKGLKDQAFDFSSVRGDVAVLIGANGSGIHAYADRFKSTVCI